MAGAFSYLTHQGDYLGKWLCALVGCCKLKLELLKLLIKELTKICSLWCDVQVMHD